MGIYLPHSRIVFLPAERMQHWDTDVRKSWLQREGIRVDAFEQKGTALTNSKAVLPEDAKRRDDTLIAPWQKLC